MSFSLPVIGQLTPTLHSHWFMTTSWSCLIRYLENHTKYIFYQPHQVLCKIKSILIILRLASQLSGHQELHLQVWGQQFQTYCPLQFLRGKEPQQPSQQQQKVFIIIWTSLVSNPLSLNKRKMTKRPCILPTLLSPSTMTCQRVSCHVYARSFQHRFLDISSFKQTQF